MATMSTLHAHCCCSGASVLLAVVFASEVCVFGAEQRFRLEIPRVNVEQLEENRTLRTGLHAYVLQGFAGEKWKAKNWTLNYINKKIPFEWVDYYPSNMDDMGSKPYLYKFEEALPRFKQRSEKPKYMQIRLGLRGWSRLKKDFSPKPVPDIFWDDDEWIGECMKGESGKADKRAIDNFFTTNQWKFLLIGERGTNMFFHKDGTAASSWQAQLVGRKKWTLCPNTESRLLEAGINTFNPDYKKHPNFGQALCGQVTLEPGELLYYPAYWWHHPWNLETPTISYTGALVGVEADRTDLYYGETKPHAAFFKDLKMKCSKCWKKGKEERECEDISLKWPGAAPPPLRIVCDVYLPRCQALWDAHATSLHRQRKGGEL